MSNTKQTDFVQDIVQKGGEVYIVGGSVRNMAFAKIHTMQLPEIKDVDMLVRLISLENLEEVLKGHGIIKEVGKSFGVIKFSPRDLKGSFFNTIDIALPRTEKSIGCGYKEFDIQSDPNLSLEDDFKRRDATINALALRIYCLSELFAFTSGAVLKSSIIDPTGLGLTDVKNKLWRAVGSPTDRFKEDPTRIMRALRQVAELDLFLEKETSIGIIENLQLLNVIIKGSPSRLLDEFVRLVSSKHIEAVMDMISFMDFIGLFKLLEVAEETEHFEEAIYLSAGAKYKVALLLMYNKEIEIWSKKFSLPACQYIKASDVPFVISFNKQFKNMQLVLEKPIIERRYELLKIIAVIEKEYPRRGKEIMSDCVECIKYYLEADEHEKLACLFKQLSNKPVASYELNIDGTYIMSKLNVNGREIGKIKDNLLEQVFRDKIENEVSSLEKAVDLLKN